MGLVTWGWGSCDGVITTYGWGSSPCSDVSTIIATLLVDKAYEWVVGVDRLEVRLRGSGSTVLRLKPSSVPFRLRGQIFSRLKNDVLIRSANRPFEIGDRSYSWMSDDNSVEIKLRGSGTTLMRLKPSDIPKELKDQISIRLKGESSIRSPGWPFEMEEFENS